MIGVFLRHFISSIGLKLQSDCSASAVNALGCLSGGFKLFEGEHLLAIMEFLSTDNQECSFDHFLSNSCQVFPPDELHLLIEAHDVMSQQLTQGTAALLVSNTDTSSESGIVSPASNRDEDSFHSLSSPNSSSIDSRCHKNLAYSTNHFSPLSERNRKNAIAAKLNRQKKKHYVQGLEAQVASLETENHQLQTWYSRSQESVTRLQSEVKYLKSVLANQSTLSKLLRNIPQIDGIVMSSSFNATTDDCHTTHCEDKGLDISLSPKKAKIDSDGVGGVCLHVVGNTASLEFCATCSERSAKTRR